MSSAETESKKQDEKQLEIRARAEEQEASSRATVVCSSKSESSSASPGAGDSPQPGKPACCSKQSTEDQQREAEEALPIKQTEAKQHHDKNGKDEPLPICAHLAEVQRLLNAVSEHNYLVSAEVLSALLRVQSKYLDEHPCLCTSRFRHILHQQGPEEHKILADICGELKKLTLRSSEHLYETSRLHYRRLAPRIFDLKGHHKALNNNNTKPGCDETETLLARVEAVLARLVSDHRAIFVIEEEGCNNKQDDSESSESPGDSSTSSNDQHHLDLHRKRHEEEDDCPEEVKLMKVSCEGLSLQCRVNCVANTSSSTTTAAAAAAASGSVASKAATAPVAPPASDEQKNEDDDQSPTRLLDSMTMCSEDQRRPYVKWQSAEQQLLLQNATLATRRRGMRKVQSGSNLSRYTNSSSSSKCPRKRKEQEEDDGQHDCKFSRSSSEQSWDEQNSSNNDYLLPTGYYDGLKRCHSSSEVQELQHSVLPSSASPCSAAAAASTSEESKRKIAHARKSRKERSDSLKENNRHGILKAKSKSPDTAKSNDDNEKEATPPKETASSGSKSQHHFHHTTIAVCHASNNNNANGHNQTNADDSALKKPLRGSLSAPMSGGSCPDATKSSEAGSNGSSSGNGAKATASGSMSSLLRMTEAHHQPVSWSPTRSFSEPAPTASSLLWMFEGVNSRSTEEAAPEPSLSWSPPLDESSNETWEELEVANGEVQQDPAGAVRTPFAWMNRSTDSSDSQCSESAFSSTDYGSAASVRLLQHQRYLDPSHHHHRRTRSTSTSSTGSSGSEGSTSGGNAEDASPGRSRLKSLRRQLSHVRRRLEELELGFEETQGYRPSQADKQTDKKMRKLLSEQSQLKKQIRSVKESANGGDLDDCASSDSVDYSSWRPSREALLDSSPEENNNDSAACVASAASAAPSTRRRRYTSVRNSLFDMEQRLKTERLMRGRPKSLDEMSAEQLVDEKADLHAALHDFESLFGQPENEDEKALLKELSDRYRTVKRLVRRSSAGRANPQLQELETIPEHEALPFTLASPQHRIQLELHGAANAAASNSGNGNNNNNNGEGVTTDGGGGGGGGSPTRPSLGLTRSAKSVDLTELDKRYRKKQEMLLAAAADDEVYAVEQQNQQSQQSQQSQQPVQVICLPEPMPELADNLHDMGRYELLQVLSKTKEEKRTLRRAIKAVEESFQRQNGRRLLKEERELHGGTEVTDVYQSYKKAKAKLKLVDALLSKQVDDNPAVL